jgi:hypothetical protein
MRIVNVMLSDFVELCSTRPGTDLSLRLRFAEAEALGHTDKFIDFCEHIAKKTKQTLWFRPERPVIESNDKKLLWLMHVTAWFVAGDEVVRFAGDVQVAEEGHLLVQGGAANDYNDTCAAFEIKGPRLSAADNEFIAHITKRKAANVIRKTTKPTGERGGAAPVDEAIGDEVPRPGARRRSSVARAPAG